MEYGGLKGTPSFVELYYATHKNKFSGLTWVMNRIGFGKLGYGVDPRFLGFTHCTNIQKLLMEWVGRKNFYSLTYAQ